MSSNAVSARLVGGVVAGFPGKTFACVERTVFGRPVSVELEFDAVEKA